MSGESPCKTHQKCPECGSPGGYSLWANGNGYCHSCGYKPKVKEKETGMKASFKVEYRHIPTEVAKHFDCPTLVDDDGNAVGRMYRVYEEGQKVRNHPKDIRASGGYHNRQVGGLSLVNKSQDMVVVFEGEEDMLAGHTMLNHINGFKRACVCVPGSSLHKDFFGYDSNKNFEFFASQKEIVLVPDNDKPGQAIVERFANTFPGKVSVVSLSKHKDAGDFLYNDDVNDFMEAFHNRKRVTAAGIYNSRDQFLDILSAETSGDIVETRFSSLNTLIKGLHTNQFHVITGLEGKGKTEILRALEWDVLTKSDKKIAVVHMEEDNETYLRTLACHALGENVRFKDETTITNKEIVDAIEKEIGSLDRLTLFNFPDEAEPLSLLEYIRQFKTVNDISFVFIDPIQQLAYDKVDDTEKTLSKLSVRLGKLCAQLPIGIVCSAHQNSEGGTRSSQMIGKTAGIRIDAERDHMAVDEELRNTTFIQVSKNRPRSLTGQAGEAYFDFRKFTVEDK